jgi:integrase
MSAAPEATSRRKSRGRLAGEGTIYRTVEVRSYTRQDGSIGESTVERWRADVDLGVEGGRRRRKHLYGATADDVARKLRKLQADVDRGRRPSIDSDRTTVAEWFEVWLEDVVKRSRRPNTYLLYRDSVRGYIAPILGRKRLTALRRAHVDELIRELERTHLAARTIHRVWAVLHSGLQHAVRTERLAVNPASQPSLPRVEKQEARALTRDEVQLVLQGTAEQPDAALYALELATGLREGELLGLRWAKNERTPGVDIMRGEVRVYEQLQHGQLVPLKRGASRRVLRLSAPLIDILRRHHTRQLEQQLLAGQRWQEHHLVFPSSVGTPRRGSNLWRSWQRLLKRLGLPAYKFHELRHTAASLALAEGASLFHVSRMLGHSSISITADTYGHMTDEGREDVAARMGRALFGTGASL